MRTLAAWIFRTDSDGTKYGRLRHSASASVCCISGLYESHGVGILTDIKSEWRDVSKVGVR